MTLSRKKVTDWAGEEKIFKMIVKAGEEEYARQLIKLMYSGEFPYSKGIASIFRCLHQFCISGGCDL